MSCLRARYSAWTFRPRCSIKSTLRRSWRMSALSQRYKCLRVLLSATRWPCIRTGTWSSVTSWILRGAARLCLCRDTSYFQGTPVHLLRELKVARVHQLRPLRANSRLMSQDQVLASYQTQTTILNYPPRRFPKVSCSALKKYHWSPWQMSL